MRTALVALSLVVLTLAEDEERLRALLARLGESDAAAREEAQQELERLGTTPEAALKEALKATKDPEARTRIEGLLETIKAERALFEAIPPERLAEISPLVHDFHAEWHGQVAENKQPSVTWERCRCAFQSIRELTLRGSTSVAVLTRIVARVRADS